MKTPKAARPVGRLKTQNRPWVAWTRYPLGGWRRTFLGVNPDACLAAVQNSFGDSVETLILPAGENPTLD